ncbi:hypothetical protein EC912_102235 [Luteibacter rhizovicinus]|uniref:Uncharacterized protein n=1 Tax=Luteibacter rhizovicinus TaxID=242606 RepID=A0A4R3YTQ3_9GAMM|nr:hypothetical protein [Luteibacter rhizovicinus]TCV95890.1 hypothetical protein EC912_102235 [Luteibacter rhizovicinus]
MIVFTALVMLVVSFWLVFALIGAVFKLAFGIIGGVFSIIASVLGVLFGGLALLIAGPIVAIAMLPLLAPVLLVAVIVWLIARSARRPQVVVTQAAPTTH